MSDSGKHEVGRLRLQVRLRVIPTAEGGRRSGIFAGYRAMWDNGDRATDGAVLAHDAPVVAIATDPDPVPPGGEAEAEIAPLFPEYWRGVAAGARLSAYEGRRLVATATVLRVVVDDPH